MAKLKDRIRETAKRLFEEKGYEAVSLRAIAKGAGTTIGNLTYHYPQKEDLIVAIQEVSQANFLGGMDDIPTQPQEIMRHMLLMAAGSQSGHEQNAFYFRNVIELCGNVTAIRERVVLFRYKIFHAYLECFDRLRNAGHMRTDIPIKNYSNLAYTIVVLVTVWTQNGSPYYDTKLPRSSLSESIYSLIFPYLTHSGMELMQQVENSK